MAKKRRPTEPAAMKVGGKGIECKYCGHRYLQPCTTEKAAKACSNVKLKGKPK